MFAIYINKINNFEQRKIRNDYKVANEFNQQKHETDGMEMKTLPKKIE